MTRGRTLFAVMLALVAVLGFCVGSSAAEKPIYITKQASPTAPQPTPDPNWELKEQMGIVPDPGQSVPDFDPNGKVGPRKGPAPPMTFKTGYLAEGFEGGIVPPAGWSAIVNNPFTWEVDSYNPFEGTYNATCFYDETYSGTQDEWLTSPVMDFETATVDLKLEFAVMMSYYWGVSPYDNYDVEVWISTDAGANFTTKLWDETALGVFTTWQWYEVVVNLGLYAGEKDVVIGFRYYGYDGAQAGIDFVSVNDNPPPPGRCCFGTPTAPSCSEVTEAACTALPDFISWDEALTCADACPVAGPGDNCSSPVVVTLPLQMPYSDNNYTCGRGDDYSGTTCLGYYDGGEDIVYQLTVTSEVTVDIALDPLGTSYTGILVDDNCPPDASCLAYSTKYSGTHLLSGITLAPGTYYIMIDTWPAPDCIPEFDLTITEFAGSQEGDDCTNPILVKLPDDLPYANTNYTCGRINNYSNTCLGSYDGGEDIIYQLDVASAVSLDIMLDPKGTTWTGIAVDDACPFDASSCIATHTNTGGSAHGIIGLNLAPGTYYIMIDTYPAPDCIPTFDLTIQASGGGPENDDCADATPIGDVTNLPFTTLGAGYDGGGSCLTSPNVWYCYTATCDGFATFSLCGSGYDTKMAVYDGCSCPVGTQLGCNDDYCGLQSELRIAVTAGHQYLVEVGGYGSNSGTGILNVSCEGGEPPENDNCSDVTPVTLVTNVTTTFTGNNENATGDCATLDPGATEVWEAFTLTQKMDVTIDLCGTSPAFELVYVVLADACPCGELIFAATTNWDLCSGDGNITMTFPGLDAGTYYLPVLSYHPSYPPSSYYYAGDYTIHVLGTPWVQAYCAASGGCDEYISRVQLADIDNSTACTGYGDYTGQIANLQFGMGYPITVTIGSAYSSDYGGVWVDWNQDYDFDDAGEAIALAVSSGVGPYTGTITVPGDATPGNTRMRVRVSYYSYPPACGATSYGEAEDYTINVGGAQSELTIDPASISFGTVPVGGSGNRTLTLGADGSAPINFTLAIEYAKKAGYGGGVCDPTLKASPFKGAGAMPPADKAPNQLLLEGFESGTVPPPGWSAIVNNAFTWEVGTYLPYEGAYYATCLYDEDYTGTQDEWLVSPVINFAGGKYVLDFWWNGSYYWSVTPYDNCDLEVWISTDGGATWLAKLWDENNLGVFTSWQWYNAIVDLSLFKNETNVKIAFHYYGYDGAQFSVDMVTLNPAPLSWLSVVPGSGSIPGNGTVPITVSCDASDLEEGPYAANIVITHTGAAKTVDLVPVSMIVGAIPTDYIIPTPMHLLYAYQVEPMTGHMYVYPGALSGYPGYDLGDIDPSTFMVNGNPAIIIPPPDYPAESFFDISFSVHEFLSPYEPIWGIVILPYAITGTFTDDTPFTLNYEVRTLGFMPGDANLNGTIDISDAVFLLNAVFRGGEQPQVEATADANCDGAVNIADAVRLVNYIFRGGAAPCHL